ncbi:MAG TPA: class I SAM-dependent methyltransferase [Candidatus Polarisedimenticolia bacterium]|nr:class I SAM-dependent methyltransferase [Candidatus Polarisedimenticolia bacterium]
MRLSTVVGDLRLGIANAVRAGLHPDQVPDPPRRFVERIGGGDYRGIGDALCRNLLEQGGLRPSDRLLDIGCGVGRLAAPLTRYLQGEGRYEGFDIDPELVEWCRRNITRRHPRFRFRAVDVHSDYYRPAGAVSGSAFTFPYEAGSFDLVAATSLFTHLLTGDAENYLRESARVLAPGGTFCATFFLLDAESLALQNAKRGDRVFRTEPVDAANGQVHHIMRADQPEAAVAYAADWLRRAVERAGFGGRVEIHPGGWCGRAKFVTYQDLVIAKKTA